jgi:GNAT superfamily N-acetyltransferase
MSEVIDVRLLSDAPHVIPTVAQWYKNEWANWFRDTPLAEIEHDFHDLSNREGAPFALVAFSGTQPVGICSVRDETFAPYPHVRPWLRGLLVQAPFRGRGVASAYWPKPVGMLQHQASSSSTRQRIRPSPCSNGQAGWGSTRHNTKARH